MPEDMTLPDRLPERLERARKTAIHELLTELGVEDTDTLKRAVEENSLFKTQLEQLTAENQQTVQRLTESQQAQQQLRIEMAFQQASAAYDFLHPADARTLLDMSAVTLDEHGQVVGMQTAVEHLVETRPYLLRRPSAPRLEGDYGRDSRMLEEKAFTAEEVESIKRRFRMGW